MITITYNPLTQAAVLTMDADDAAHLIGAVANLPAGVLTDAINRLVARIAGLFGRRGVECTDKN
jgi:hypothetical protein